LSPEEIVLRKDMKCKCLGLASLATTIARQRSRMMFLVVVNPEYIMASDKAVTWLERWGGGNASLNWSVQER
jgi:hypothetical protein